MSAVFAVRLNLDDESGIRWNRVSQALTESRIFLGWNQIGDVRSIGCEQDRLKLKMRAAYGADISEGAISQWAGNFRRFLCDIKIDDCVIVPDVESDTCHFGRVTGDPQYDPDAESDGIANSRSVSWLTNRHGVEYRKTLDALGKRSFGQQTVTHLHGWTCETLGQMLSR
jgi:predicted Mrr-cat superfamily restriction endonuclease